MLYYSHIRVSVFMFGKKKELNKFEKKLNDWVAKHLTRISFTDKMFFVDHLKVMVHAGLSLVEALEILSKETGNEAMKMVIKEVTVEVSGGKQLSEVLLKHPKVFLPIYVKMIEAGEVSGKLEESLTQIALQMKKTHELSSSIRGAMIYPSVVLLAMVGIGVLMTTVILPKLLTIFDEFDSELPLATQILMAVTDFMSKPVNLVFMTVVIVLCTIGFIYLMKHSPKFRIAIHTILLHMPIIGKVIKKINLARFSLTLSSLMKSAIPIVDAITITAATCGNVNFRISLMKTAKEIETGIPLSDSLRAYEYLYPPMVTEMIMVGERTGEIDELLTELSTFYNNEVDKTMKNFTTIIEPILIIILGLVVGGVAVAVIMPMYSLVQNF
jgi:type IV pilus assembly protein PilC